jgi:hypothetical protein
MLEEEEEDRVSSLRKVEDSVAPVWRPLRLHLLPNAQFRRALPLQNPPLLLEERCLLLRPSTPLSRVLVLSLLLPNCLRRWPPRRLLLLNHALLLMQPTRSQPLLSKRRPKPTKPLAPLALKLALRHSSPLRQSATATPRHSCSLIKPPPWGLSLRCLSLIEREWSGGRPSPSLPSTLDGRDEPRCWCEELVEIPRLWLKTSALCSSHSRPLFSSVGSRPLQGRWLSVR